MDLLKLIEISESHILADTGDGTIWCDSIWDALNRERSSNGKHIIHFAKDETKNRLINIHSVHCNEHVDYEKVSGFNKKAIIFPDKSCTSIREGFAICDSIKEVKGNVFTVSGHTIKLEMPTYNELTALIEALIKDGTITASFPPQITYYNDANGEYAMVYNIVLANVEGKSIFFRFNNTMGTNMQIAGHDTVTNLFCISKLDMSYNDLTKEFPVINYYGILKKMLPVLAHHGTIKTQFPFKGEETYKMLDKWFIVDHYVLPQIDGSDFFNIDAKRLVTLFDTLDLDKLWNLLGYLSDINFSLEVKVKSLIKRGKISIA